MSGDPPKFDVFATGVSGSVIVTLGVFLNAVAEVSVTPFGTAADYVNAFGAACLLVGAPILLLAGIDHALTRTKMPHAVGFWSPPLLGLVFFALTSFQSGVLSPVVAIGITLGCLAAGVLAARNLSFFGSAKSSAFSAPTVWWVVLSAILFHDAIDTTSGPSTATAGLPLLAGIAGVGVQSFAVWAERQPKLRSLGLGAGLLLAAVAAFVLQNWLVELNMQLKLWLILSIATGVSALGREIPGAKVIAAFVLVIALAFGGWKSSQDIPSRFAGTSTRSTAGTAARLLSSFDDADRDGFYSDAVGGNDCDDTDASIHPASATGCWSDLAAELVSPNAKPIADDVLIVIIDAMRADAIEHAPNLSELAKQNVSFTRAWAPGNSTFLSVPTMLSGQSPVAAIKTMSENDKYEDLLKGKTVFDVSDEDCDVMIVQAHGYADWLFAYYPKPELRSFSTQLTDTGHGAPFAVEKLQGALEKCGDKPVTAVVYIDDPHIEQPELKYTCRDGSQGGRECYHEEIGVVDDALGKMLTLMDSRKRPRLTVVTADHGEAFEEHGHRAHTSSVFNEQIAVPLVVAGTGDAAKVVTQPTTLLAIPALVEAYKVGATQQKRAHGNPLSCGVANPCLAPLAHNWLGHVKRGWTPPSTAVTDGKWKLVYFWKTNRSLVFDLEADPQESKPLDEPEVEQRLMTALKRTFATEMKASLSGP